MCGIAGYTGKRRAAEVLLEALSGLEYRGYDSAGISVFEENGIVTVKSRGRLERLSARVRGLETALNGTCGIGHTRWATHGEPSGVNAHPHVTEKLALVHNGIIENHLLLRKKLQAQGCKFTSQTDTEAAARLLDRLYEGDPVGAIAKACAALEGSYAFAVLFADRPGEIYAARRNCPLIAAREDGGSFVASDISAILRYTGTYILLDEGDIARVTPEAVTVWGADGTEKTPEPRTAQWTVEQARKNGYDHFMLKEIHEQPQALRDTIHPRVADGLPVFDCLDNIPEGFWRQFKRISIAACGTAWHAGMLGKALIEGLARIPVECCLASEFRYGRPLFTRHTLVILISQSGETADTLAALRLAREAGAATLAVVNAAGSSIAREADYVIHTFAGPEIAVASTKAFSVQLGIMYLTAIKFALAGGVCPPDEARRLTRGLLDAVEALPKVFGLNDAIREQAKTYVPLRDLFFLGRGLDYALAMEGALKLKEISYIHCEAYAAGELKHGTISLITPGTPVVVLATQEALLPKTLSNAREAASRGAEILMLCKEGGLPDSEPDWRCLALPDLDDMFMPIPGAAALQLLAYHTAVLRGCDADKPRNLAKSVTVE